MKHSLETYNLFFGSLSNPNRLKILNVLRNKNLNVGEICNYTKFEQTMVSHNLKRLERCGMVFSEQKGKQRYYSLNKKTILPLLKAVDSHNCDFCRKNN